MRTEVTITMTESFTDLATRIKNESNETVKLLADTLVTDINKVFDEEGPGWRELSEWRKSERGDSGHPILEDTGRLRDSIKVREVGEGKYDVGTDVPYATLHEFGGTNPEGYVVPERSFMRKAWIENEAKYKQLAEDKAREIINE